YLRTMAASSSSSMLEQYLSRLRSNDPTLTILYLSSNSIGASGASELATALQHNSTLTTLDLSWNKIGDSGASGLAAALQHNSTLTILDLYNNSIGDSGASALATALQNNPSLTTLDPDSILTTLCLKLPPRLRDQVNDLFERNKVNAVKKSSSLFELLLPFLSVFSSPHSETEHQANSYDWSASNWTDSNFGPLEESLDTNLCQSWKASDWEQPVGWSLGDIKNDEMWDAENPFDS
ncbi:MAG: hypothetical protein Q8P67_21040, partial [archaeon]|nr:hypothetical protein [archaeon]